MDAYSRLTIVVLLFAILSAMPGTLLGDVILIYGNDFSLPIPADTQDSRGRMDDAILDIGEHHIISDIDVAINITHTNVFDLQIYLQSPSGTEICLNRYNLDEFFIGQNYSQTIFDDEADTAIEQGTAPFTGSFRPRAGNKLDVFDGQDIYGTWKLRVYDTFYYDTGLLNRFELMITTPESASFILFMLGTAFVFRFT